MGGQELGRSWQQGAGLRRCCEETVLASFRPSVANSLHRVDKVGKSSSVSNWEDHFDRKLLRESEIVPEGKVSVVGSSASRLGKGRS